jgi:hypothetical protein
MTTFTTFKPGTTFTPPVPTAMFDTWSGIAGLYKNAAEASAQQWVTSSAGIIQQHTMQAFINASQACAQALAKNAVSVQQKSMERFVDANQKAAGMVGKAMTDAWCSGFKPLR